MEICIYKNYNLIEIKHIFENSQEITYLLTKKELKELIKKQNNLEIIFIDNSKNKLFQKINLFINYLLCIEGE